MERALMYITPIIVFLPDGERVAISYYCVYPKWELTYVSRAGTSADPATWDAYLNVAPD